MTTPADAIKSALNTNWNVGTGGTKPEIEVTEDWTSDWPAAQDTIMGRTWTYRHREVPVDSVFVNRFHDITFRVSTSDITSGTQREDRLTEMVDEVKRIFRANGVTGFHVARVVTVDQNPSDKSRSVFRADLGIHLIEYLVNAATVAGSTGSLDFAVGGDFTVAGDTELTGDFSFDTGEHVDVVLDEDDMASDDEDALATQQSIKAYVDVVYAAAMIGSANAAWVPCTFDTGQPVGKFTLSAATERTITNVDATDFTLHFTVPLVPIKDSLKLYISGVRVGLADADANDYVDTTQLKGIDSTAQTSLDQNNTNLTSSGDNEDTFTAVDCSAHDRIGITLYVVSTTANEFDLSYVSVRAYYDT